MILHNSHFRFLFFKFFEGKKSSQKLFFKNLRCFKKAKPGSLPPQFFPKNGVFLAIS